MPGCFATRVHEMSGCITTCVAAELQQLQAEMARLQGDLHLQGQQQQQHPGMSLALSCDVLGV